MWSCDLAVFGRGLGCGVCLCVCVVCVRVWLVVVGVWWLVEWVVVVHGLRTRLCSVVVCWRSLSAACGWYYKMYARYVRGLYNVGYRVRAAASWLWFWKRSLLGVCVRSYVQC